MDHVSFYLFIFFPPDMMGPRSSSPANMDVSVSLFPTSSFLRSLLGLHSQTQGLYLQFVSIVIVLVL